MKKILYITTVSSTINAFLVPHIHFLLNKGYEIDCASNMVQTLDVQLSNKGVRTFNLPFNRNPFNPNNIIAFFKLLGIQRKEKYDYIHVHTPVAAMYGRLLKLFYPNLVVIYTAHGFHFFRGAPRKNWALYYLIEKQLSFLTDYIITINEEDFIAAKKFNKRLKKNVFKINGVGVDLEKFTKPSDIEKAELRKNYGYNKNDLILIYIAELNNNKNQGLPIEVIHSLIDKIPNIKLLLVGNGVKFQDYRLQVEELNLNEKVLFLGFRNDVPQLLKIADIAISASKREGLPVNIMEAMATGLPIILTKCRGNKDLVAHKENGYLIDFSNSIHDDFCLAILNLYNSKTLREEYGTESKKLVSKYSLNHVLEELNEIYTIILSDN